MDALPRPDDEFAALLHAIAAERVRDAATARARTHWLRRRSEEEGTMAGVLVDLAERAAPVVCTTSAGRRHHGVLRALGADFVALGGEQGATVLLARPWLAHVRTAPGTATVSGDRGVRVELRLNEVLTGLAGDRPDVVVGTGAAEVRGELRAVGRDVLTLRMTGRPGGAAYVALACAQEVRVR